MESIAAFLERNWAVIKQAPWVFALLAALASGLGYAVASRNSSDLIATLQERIKLKDDQLAKNSRAWEQEFIEKRTAPIGGILPIMEGREYDVFYQDGKKVGRAVSSPKLIGIDSLEFESIEFSADVDERKNFEYNDLVLQMQKSFKRADGSGKFGALCVILERRR